MDFRVLSNSYSDSLIMLKVVGKKLSDGIKYCSNKCPDDTENVWNTLSHSMHSVI